MNIENLIEEVFQFLEGKRKMIDVNHIKALAVGYCSAMSRVQKLENTRSYLWVNQAHPSKMVLKPSKKHGKVALGRN